MQLRWPFRFVLEWSKGTRTLYLLSLKLSRLWSRAVLEKSRAVLEKRRHILE
jgi:hypothetical protein